MKKVYSVLLSFLLPVLSSAQITITNADLPSSGDQIQFSQAAVTTPVDLTLTGANYLWDFFATSTYFTRRGYFFIRAFNPFGLCFRIWI
jgi:hypothetical protein